MLHRVRQNVGLLPGVIFATALMLAVAMPASAQTNPAKTVQSKRTTTSFENVSPPAAAGSAATHGGFSGGLLYFPGPQTGLNIGGRLNVGKSHVYVPYYGNVSNDPTHPGVQGTAGIAYGFRTWDISVSNGTFGSQPQASIPGAGSEASKVNPAVTFSIRF